MPFLPYKEAYKHLGWWRCADGSDRLEWTALRRHFASALRRLRRMRKPPRHIFITVSEALLSGLGTYYFQCFYLTWEQAEMIERQWRAAFVNASKTSAVSRNRQAPRVQLYRGGICAGGPPVKRHLWAVALTSLYSTMCRAMADVEPTAQRTAAHHRKHRPRHRLRHRLGSSPVHRSISLRNSARSGAPTFITPP